MTNKMNEMDYGRRNEWDELWFVNIKKMEWRKEYASTNKTMEQDGYTWHPPSTSNIFTVWYSLYQDGFPGLVAEMICLVFGSVSVSLSISLSFSILTNFESTFIRWRLFLRIRLPLSFNIVWDRDMSFLLRIIPVRVQMLFW